MKDGQKQYRILRIDEPDFGCEGHDDGEAAYDGSEKTDRSGDVVSGWTSAAGRKNIRCAH